MRRSVNRHLHSGSPEALSGPPHSTDRRVAILSDLTSTFKEWVHSVCLAKGLPQAVAEAAGGALFTSGSYRLGLNEVGMDIDTVCVAPRMVRSIWVAAA